MDTRHFQFSLACAETGVEAWLSEPSTAVVFLTMIAEALVKGFGAPQQQQAGR